jgi:hypothetical protein
MAVFQLYKQGKCKCSADPAACKCERVWVYQFRFEGKQYTRRAPNKAKAQQLEAAYRRELESKRSDEVLAFLRSDDSRMRRVNSSIAAVGEAYMTLATWVKPHVRRANWNRLMQCCAWSWDMWTENTGGKRGVKVGEEVPDLEKIGAVSVGKIDSESFVEDYFLHRQQDAGLATDHLYLAAAEEHATWTSVLKQGLDVFSSMSMKRAFKGLSVPDMQRARKADKPKSGARRPEPFSSQQFADLCRHFDSLRLSDPDFWLMNVIHRQTGMRPKYVMGLRGSWLQEGAQGKWFIKIIDRPAEGFEKKDNTLDQFIPITAELRDLIAARGDGLTIMAGGTITARKLLQKRHNLELKTVIDAVGTHGQGVYRYRDTVASALTYLLGLDAAQWALGHTTSKTTAEHYSSALPGVSDLMQSELAAWLTARKPQ